MHTRLFHALLCALGMLVLSQSAHAATLYGATAAGAAGELYILNPASGAVVQDVGPLNDAGAVNYGMTGLAFSPVNGLLYGATHNSGAAPASTRARLVTIDPNTAVVTVIGAFNAGNVGTPATMADIAFDAAGNLYGVGSVGGPQLYSINITTGQATVIGNTGLTSTTGGGLGVSSSNVFFGTPTASRFGTYDSITGLYTNIANPTKPVGGAYAALSFDDTGVLYGLNLGSASPPPTHLVTIDPITGAVTDIGASVNSLDAIAFVPEPGAAVLFGTLAVTLLANRRRRR